MPGGGLLATRYGRRLAVLFAGTLAAGLVVRALLVPESFGDIGHYRALAPAEEAAREPVLRGSGACGTCHAQHLARHDKDLHFRVQCEACHGPGDAHVKARTAGAPAGEGIVFRELEQANCLACHARLAARPRLFPTVDVAEHFALVGVTDKATRCQSCHNPHEPLFLDQPVSKARIHPLIHPCRDCHAERGIETKPLPDGHVVTFRCGDCHGDVVADAAGKAHGRLDCRTCHVFHKDSEFSGRILKNGNPRFCLMCHQDRPFVAGSRIPHIASLEAHVAEMASSDEDKAKRCADCHLDDAVHRRRAGAPNVVAPGGER